MRTTNRDWLIPAGLILLGAVPAIAGTARLAQLAGGAPFPAESARFFENPLPVALHIPAAIVFSLLGALQFSPGLRRARPAAHRAVGRVLAPAAFVVAVTGLWMTLAYPWPAGDGALVYAERLVVGSAMLAFVVLGVADLGRRRFASHGDWMTRAYALGLGAGTQVLTHLPWFILVGPHPGEGPRAVMMGGAWAINAVVAEWVIRRRTAGRGTRRRVLAIA